MAVARQTQIIGASPHSWEDAVRNAIERANKTLRNITGLEVLKENAAGEILNCLASVAAGDPYVSPSMTGLLLRRRNRAETLAARTEAGHA